MNMLSNFIPHEIIICDDKDTLWFNRDEASKSKVVRRNEHSEEYSPRARRARSKSKVLVILRRLKPA